MAYISVSKSIPLAVTGPHGKLASMYILGHPTKYGAYQIGQLLLIMWAFIGGKREQLICRLMTINLFSTTTRV